MTPLSYLSVLKVSGDDAGKFLQSQLTAQLAGMNAPTATFSAYCSAKGQVIATLLVSPHQDHWLVLVESSLLQTLIGRLQLYILRERVRLEPLSDYHVGIPDPHDTPGDDTIFLEPRSVPLQYVISVMKAMPNPAATARWRRAELVFGVPWLNAASSEKYIPQMLGLDTIGAVSFSKGCFPGQEVIARARHLGTVKRQPQVLDIEGPTVPDPETPCFIRSSGGQVEASMVHCVATSATTFTVFAVAAIQAGEVIQAMEQNGDCWSAKRAFRESDG
jgi:folate-binding protein YgfZ